VNFRLSFYDFDTLAGRESNTGPNDGAHIHRLDNVQVSAGILSISPVPEPSAVCLLVGGFSLLGLRRRR